MHFPRENQRTERTFKTVTADHRTKNTVSVFSFFWCSHQNNESNQHITPPRLMKQQSYVDQPKYNLLIEWLIIMIFDIFQTLVLKIYNFFHNGWKLYFSWFILLLDMMHSIHFKILPRTFFFCLVAFFIIGVLTSSFVSITMYSLRRHLKV